jgi:hypothetical protein
MVSKRARGHQREERASQNSVVSSRRRFTARCLDLDGSALCDLFPSGPRRCQPGDADVVLSSSCALLSRAGEVPADKPNPWKPTKLSGLAIGENSALAVPVPILIAIFLAFLVSTHEQR